jgi:hypothetical protein
MIAALIGDLLILPATVMSLREVIRYFRSRRAAKTSAE